MALNAAAYAEDPYAQLFAPSSTEAALTTASATNPFAAGLALRERGRTQQLIQQYLEALGQTNASRERVAGADLAQMDMTDQRKFLSDTKDKTADWNAAMQFALPGMDYNQQMQTAQDTIGIEQLIANVFGTHAKGVSDLAAGGQVLPGGVPTPWAPSTFDPRSLMTPDQLDTSDGSGKSNSIWEGLKGVLDPAGNLNWTMDGALAGAFLTNEGGMRDSLAPFFRQGGTPIFSDMDGGDGDDVSAEDVVNAGANPNAASSEEQIARVQAKYKTYTDMGVKVNILPTLPDGSIEMVVGTQPPQKWRVSPEGIETRVR